MQRPNPETAMPNSVLTTEELSRALISNLPGGAAFVVDRDLRYLLAEGEALETAGFKPEDLVGQTIFEALPPDLAASYEPMYRQALAGEPFELEHNAHDRTYVSRGTPLRTTNGEIDAVLVVSYDISERKQTEAALRESEAKYRSLFESIDEGFCIFEMLYNEAGEAIDFRYIETNPGFERQSGRRPQPGQTMQELFPEAEDMWLKDYAEVARTGQSKRFIDYHEDLDRWFDVFVFPTSNGKNQLAALFSDVTDEKRAEKALRENEERQAFLLQLSDVLRSLVDPIEIQEAVTRTAMHHFGADRCYYCEIEGENAIIRRDAARDGLPSVTGIYPLSSFAILQAAIETGRPFVVQDVYTTDTVDDALKQLCIQLQVISYIDVPVIKDGQPVGVLCLVQSTPRAWTDLEVELAVETAERTWAAVKRARAEQALRESEIQRVREQSAREQERQRAESLLELDRAKTLFFSNISHEFRTPLTLLLAPLQDALSDRVNLLPPAQQDRLELSHRNGLRLLKLVNTLLDFPRIEAGRMEAIYEPTDLALFTTELASVFRSMIEQAGLRFIVDCPPLPELVYVDRQMWEKIVLNLLSNAFKFTFSGEITVTLKAELTTEPQTLVAESQTLTAESQTLTNEFQTLAHESQILTNEFQTLAHESQILTNESQTLADDFQILTNESQTLADESRSLISHAQVILEIQDTGTGIAPEHLPYLFERFYQVRGAEARSREGSGIGLALVAELVRFHGGTIEVTSTVREGTCFTIAIPFGTDHLPDDRLQSEGDRNPPTRTLASTTINATSYVKEAERSLPQAETEEASPAASAFRVLLVEDNADMREYVTRILSNHVEVQAVADGAAALTAIQTQMPDLILSDVMMPGLDGFQLLAALRADPHTREIPMILLSARAGEEAIIEGLEAGADDYLAKPFAAQELISRVNAHLQIAHQRNEALDQERTLSRRKDELLSNVSHELNTPLVSILGWTRLLRSTPPSPLMLAKALDTIERNATLQAKLVQDLLDLSRITAGKLRLNAQPIELASVIETAIATVHQATEVKGIDLIWQNSITHRNLLVLADRDRLQQVLVNLLTNAIKFTPEAGTVTVELSQTNTKTSAYAEIRVIDTGMGISTEFLPHIFDRFRQAKGTDAAKGLGLGLAIARHLVELHNGTIDAESAGEEQGTTFIVRLPLLSDAPTHD